MIFKPSRLIAGFIMAVLLAAQPAWAVPMAPFYPYDSAGNLTAKYVYGAGLDEPLRMERGGVVSYYHTDGLGSVTALTNASGVVVERYSYDIYGTPKITDGSGNARSASAFGNRFLFTGREWDSETGLYHYRARAYSPTLGRFLQRDPVGYGPDANLYRYVGNNPLNWADPTGENPLVVLLGLLEGLISGIATGVGAKIMASSPGDYQSRERGRKK